MANVLEVQIVGDVAGLDKALKQAEKLQAEYSASVEKTADKLKETTVMSKGYSQVLDELNGSNKKVSKSSKEVSKEVESISSEGKKTIQVVDNLEKELSNLKREQKDLGGSIQKDLTPKVANGGNALMQFSRIAQDAPFGIMGVGNNITATAEAFGHLRNSAGGTGAALKAVASSMLGTGGILLAVSLVTTGLTLMSQQGLSVGDLFDKLTGNFDAVGNAMNKAYTEATKSAIEETNAVKGLIAVAQDETLEKKNRIAAVNELQSRYPAYFGNLSQEKILYGDLTNVVNDLTKALINRKIAEKVSEDAVEPTLKLWQANARLLKEKEALTKAEENYNRAVGVGAVFATQRYLKELNAQKESVSDTRAEIIQLTGVVKGYEKVINDASKASSGLLIEAPKAEKALKAPKAPKAPNITPQVTAIDNQLQAQELIDVGSIAVVTGKLDEFGNKIKGISEITVPALKIPPVVTDEFISSLERARENAQIFSNAVGSSVGALASQMASSLQTGNAVLDAFVGSLIGSLAQIAQAQITALITDKFVNSVKIQGDQAVSTANAVVAATGTAASLGPAGAIALPGLIAGSTGLVAATFAGIQATAFAHGGIVPGGSFTGDKVPAMLNSGETVMNRQQQANVLMSIANGNSNALQNNRVIDNFEISSVLRGADLLLSIERQQRKR